ncbi:MAG TPA: GNAT family N-acetyltransferase [Vicinamibacterales bacterium]|nr:GNAT family N-acetyltransferase [Vicinamibacterales bacterium]
MIAPGIAERRQDGGLHVEQAPDIHCLLIDSAWSFSALRPEWSSLLRASASASPFLTWEWLHTWWTHLGGSSRLRMVAVRAGTELIAVAPFRAATGTAYLPCLDMLATGDVGSDYLDVIVRRGREAEALPAIEQFVRSQRTTLRLTHLGPSAVADLLADRLHASGWARTTTACGTCPYIPLAGHTWDSYLATLGSSHRANVRRRIRALDQKFDVRFERVTGDTQRREALAKLFEYHDRRFDERGTAFGTDDMRAFHDELTRRALDRGWLRMFVLRLDGAPAAVMYGFLYDGTFYFYQHGFDEQFQQHSIGLVLMALSIRAAIDEGAGEFDMLWGVEPYKFLWARQTRELRTLLLFPPRIGGQIHRGLYHARRQAKALIGRYVS